VQSTLGVGACGREKNAATGEEKIADVQRGRINISGFFCTVARLPLTVIYLRRVRVVWRRFTAGAHHRRIFVPLALAAQNLGVGLRRPCQGQACSGVLGAMARIAPARAASPRSTITYSLDRFPKLCTSKTCVGGGWLGPPPPPRTISRNF
jgi:hypothetical protein